MSHNIIIPREIAQYILDFNTKDVIENVKSKLYLYNDAYESAYRWVIHCEDDDDIFDAITLMLSFLILFEKNSIDQFSTSH